jgi:hypothetical protein
MIDYVVNLSSYWKNDLNHYYIQFFFIWLQLLNISNNEYE